MTIENPARLRRRLMLGLALGFALILPSAVLLQTGALPGREALLMAVLIAGCLIAAPASVGLTALQLRAAADPALRRALDDELANRNAVRALAVGYVAMLTVTGYVLPVSVFIDLPLTPVLTGLLLTGVLAYAVSFAIFERQGDDG